MPLSSVPLPHRRVGKRPVAFLDVTAHLQPELCLRVQAQQHPTTGRVDDQRACRQVVRQALAPRAVGVRFEMLQVVGAQHDLTGVHRGIRRQQAHRIGVVLHRIRQKLRDSSRSDDVMLRCSPEKTCL